LLLLLGLLLAVTAAAWWVRSKAPARRPGAVPAATNLLAALMALEAREAAAAQTIWPLELEAQRHGRVFEDLWDSLNRVTNKLAALAAFDPGQVVLPNFAPPTELPHDIRLYVPKASSAGPELAAAAWRAWLAARIAEGWELEHLEFRHNRFSPAAAGQSAESLFGFRAHLTRRTAPDFGETRAVLEGDLRVVWTAGDADAEQPAPRLVDARRIELKTRAGPPGFVEELRETVSPPPRSHFIDPLILHDLDGDGTVEVILVSANRVYRRQQEGRWAGEPLCREAPGAIFIAALADFDRDGVADLLAAKFDGLYLLPGSPGGRFTAPWQRVWAAPERIRYGQVLACGDVDGDGDLDVWFGQYKNPYDGGQMPTPFYDARDGYPAYLLLNDGRGRFTDATAAAGLDAKRTRRTYSASLADLDGDGDLDLVVVSDFAGVDLYANDGRGRFTDLTARWLEQPRAFGMAHVLADFDTDGRLDLFVTGMHCPTASRLAHLGLARPERPDYLAAIPDMIRGNKLLLARPEGGFREVAAERGVARTGWSWGCAAADFDNDGHPDLAIANGHETRQSVREYEPEFWLHDLYAADSRENPVAAQYFAAKINRLRGGGLSYGGWEQNRLFLNRGPAGFLEVAHLLGVALVEDSRNLAAADLDGDGRPDLVLTTFEAWPQARQTVRVFRNVLPRTGHWLAVRLEPGPGALAPGARVVLQFADGGRAVQTCVTGDSHRSQQPWQAHFGLGATTNVLAVEVRWPDGRLTTLDRPAPDRVHVARPLPKTPDAGP
jgi:hypothetical protein